MPFKKEKLHGSGLMHQSASNDACYLDADWSNTPYVKIRPTNLKTSLKTTKRNGVANVLKIFIVFNYQFRWNRKTQFRSLF